jgi:hypothetical protein
MIALFALAPKAKKEMKNKLFWPKRTKNAVFSTIFQQFSVDN